MDFVILGFLMIKPLSQYDLLKAFGQEVSPFYSASLGSIQTMLKKLEKMKYILCKEDTSTKRVRKVYTITDMGKSSFYSWMLSDISESKFEAQISSRVFFLGLIVDEDKRIVISKFVCFIEKEITKLKSVNIINIQKEIPADFAEIAKYQLKTLSLGLYEYEHILIWCKELLKDIGRN